MKKESVKKFDLNAAFKALDEFEVPKARRGIAANRINLKETFNHKLKTDLLLEDYFDVNDQEDLEQAKAERDAEVAQAKLARIEKIVDLDAESEEDLLPSYVGKVIVQCPQCMTLFYKNPEDLEYSEDDEATVNIGEKCQHCGNESGYTVIGKVGEVSEEERANYEEAEEAKNNEEDELDLTMPEPEEDEEDETETVEEPVEDEDLENIEDEVEDEIKEEGLTAESAKPLLEGYNNDEMDEFIELCKKLNFVKLAEVDKFAKDHAKPNGEPLRNQELLQALRDEVKKQEEKNEDLKEGVDIKISVEETPEEGVSVEAVSEEECPDCAEGEPEIVAAETEHPYDDSEEELNAILNSIPENTEAVTLVIADEDAPVEVNKEEIFEEEPVEEVEPLKEVEPFEEPEPIVEPTETEEKVEEVEDDAEDVIEPEEKVESLKESLSNSPHKDIIAKYFDYSANFEFLDVIADIIDRVDDYSDEEAIYEAISDSLIYYNDMWEVMKFYSTPQEANYDAVYEDLCEDIIAICDQINGGVVEESINLKESLTLNEDDLSGFEELMDTQEFKTPISDEEVRGYLEEDLEEDSILVEKIAFNDKTKDSYKLAKGDIEHLAWRYHELVTKGAEADPICKPEVMASKLLNRYKMVRYYFASILLGWKELKAELQKLLVKDGYTLDELKEIWGYIASFKDEWKQEYQEGKKIMKNSVAPEVEKEEEAPVESEEPTEEVKEEQPVEEVEKEEEVKVEEEPVEEVNEKEVLESLISKSLKNVYENVNNFTITDVKNNDNKLVVEGLINFNSGNTKATTYKFSKSMLNNKKIIYCGLNEDLDKQGVFRLYCNKNGSKVVPARLSYRYHINESLVKGFVK